MKKILLAVFVCAGLAVAQGAWAVDQVTICHATSSDTNPWVRIVVDSHATAGHFDNNGTPLAGHEDDVLLVGDVDCPVVPPPPPPVDVCPDMAGNQTSTSECPVAPPNDTGGSSTGGTIGGTVSGGGSSSHHHSGGQCLHPDWGCGINTGGIIAGTSTEPITSVLLSQTPYTGYDDPLQEGVLVVIKIVEAALAAFALTALGFWAFTRNNPQIN